MVIHPSYFGSISQFALMVKKPTIYLEVSDNYQKQTYRNRTYIYGASGKLMLNIPIIHNKEAKRQKTKEVKIESDFDWRKQHLKSLKNAYQTSPFFEFYEDDFVAFYQTEFTHLLEVNLASLKLVTELLDLDIKYIHTTNYQPIIEDKEDCRFLINAKNKPLFKFETYTQLFDKKYGFLPDLSILDLLFMEGTNAVNYLENQVRKT